MSEEDELGIYSYGALQTIYLRQTPNGPSDWQWSFNKIEWNDTLMTQVGGLRIEWISLQALDRVDLHHTVAGRSWAVYKQLRLKWCMRQVTASRQETLCFL